MVYLRPCFFDDPERFIDSLYLRNDLWKPNSNEWIFRGQSNSAWDLMPTAFRSTAALVDIQTGQISRGVRSTVREQSLAEYNTLRRFLGRCNEQGLPFATADDSVFDIDSFDGGVIDEWPPRRILPNLGLAQHYRISTRLIDWTSSATVAGYFAVRSAAERWHKGGAVSVDSEFCVWALYQPSLWELRDIISIVHVPRSSNPNLHAQSGLFVAYHPYVADVAPRCDDPFALEYPFVPLALDAVIARHYGDLSRADLGAPILMKLTAPLRLAPAVLRILNDIGMNASAIYPGYKGAADAVVEREFWDR